MRKVRGVTEASAHTLLTCLAFGCLGWKIVTTILVVRHIERPGAPVNR
jgi:hypothetical protein